MFKYACLNNISSVGLEGFDANYTEVENPEEADGFLVRSAKLHDMEFSDNLLAIARAGAGVNNIPLERCAEKGIVVFNTPGANANGVKELVFAGMLLAARDIVEGIDWVRENSADENLASNVEKQKKQYAGTELAGKKLGVIGLGAIGVRVANMAVRLNMDVMGYDPYVSVDSAWNLSRAVKHVTNAEDIYKECDFITIHVPLMDATKGMISAEAISKMKKGVVIVNMARDALVDEKAVVAAIDEGRIHRYVSDFPNNTTAGHKGCIVTPHLGASTEESEDNCAMMAVRELRDYLENGNITNSVNYPACNMGPAVQAGRIGIFHKNQKNMISRFTTILGDAGMNIHEMANKSKGDYAYTMFDLDTPVTEESVEKLKAVEDVYRVRVVK